MSRARDGFILVTVLWVLGALAALVSVYTAYLSVTAQAAAVRDDSLSANGLFTAGLELAALQIVSVPETERPMSGTLAFRLGSAEISASFRNETARIDLNTAPPDLMAGLFAALGANEDDAKTYAARILAFRTPAQASSGDGEAALYRQAGLDHGPRGGPFVHADELWLVRDLPPRLVEAALPHVTIYSGAPTIAPAIADPLVRAAVPAPAGGSTPDASAAPAVPAATSDAVRVTLSVAFRDGGRRAAEAVILVRDFGDDPYRVLSWREDGAFEGMSQMEAGR
ncbi:general secretion pathway protein GspK [Terrihabitans sp. B22-R8]|uniref:general secretion pathway protein GspK n=1 Tax=Terrihabitans sp. B22-R8 TaxID=3425128 RepID=UPI00403C3904